MYDEENCLSIQLFGRFELRRNDRHIPLPAQKLEWVLALLLLRHGCPLRRPWLAGMLWVDSLHEQSLTNLRNSLTLLRRALGADAWRVQSPTPRTLAFDASGVSVDLFEFDDAIEEGSAAAGERAVRLHRGPLLEDCSEPWVFSERQAREQNYLHALERLAARARARADAHSAERYLRRVIAVDPMRESAHRDLMELLADGGNRAEALMTYRDLRHLLHREMNAEPDDRTTALFQSLRQG